MNLEVVHLFVYGTLMPGHRLHPRIERFVRQVRPGSITGVLVDAGSFPALISGRGRVRGALLDLFPEALVVTDAIEGYRPDRQRSLYTRIEAQVILDTREQIMAWTYRFANEALLSDRPRLVVGQANGLPLYAWPPHPQHRD